MRKYLLVFFIFSIMLPVLVRAQNVGTAEVDSCRLLVPTGFSPNGDGVNDIFRAISHLPVSDFSMQVYNRWGEKVYSTTNIQNGWDGTYKNLNQPVAVYVYYINYMNYCEGKMELIKGNVTLVR